MSLQLYIKGLDDYLQTFTSEKYTNLQYSVCNYGRLLSVLALQNVQQYYVHGLDTDIHKENYLWLCRTAFGIENSLQPVENKKDEAQMNFTNLISWFFFPKTLMNLPSYAVMKEFLSYARGMFQKKNSTHISPICIFFHR